MFARPAFAALALAALPIAAGAQDAADGAESVSGRYVIDPAHSKVQFTVERFGFNHVIGAFKSMSGEIVLDEAAPENSSVNVEIDVASVYSGDDTRDEHLNGPFWFETENHPTASFASTAVELTGDNAANVAGDLTIHGVTQPATLAITLNKVGTDPATKKQAAGFTGSAELARADFGLTTAEALIGGDVAIRIEVLAHRAEETDAGEDG